MKFKQNWKRFWTLNRHHAEGFTLVELIVVIAVLAILGGVAVPAYSGYITRANKQADMSLAYEVRDALVLHYYADPNNAVADYVVLSPTAGAVAGGEFATAAMLAVFGEGWEDALSLKYSNWAEDSGYSNVGGSNLANVDTEELAGTVNSLTNLAAAVIGSNSPQMATNIIKTMFGDDEIATELQQYEGDPNYNTIASNLLVKYFAEDLGDAKVTTDENGDLMVEGMEGGLSDFAATYAMLYSMANSDSAYKDTAAAKLDTLNTTMEDIVKREQDDSTTKVQQLLMGAIGEMLSDTEPDENGVTFGQAYTEYVNANNGAEMTALFETMGLVNSLSNNFSEEALSNPNMFDNETMVNRLNVYKMAMTKNGIAISIDQLGNTEVFPTIAE